MKKELRKKTSSTISIPKDLISFSILGGQSNLSIDRSIQNKC